MIILPDDFPLRAFFSALAFGWGACIGSFLNVCIYRIPRDLSVITPRSFCPLCSAPIPWFCNIPIISYVLLGGKCRSCKGRISPRYALVEAITAIAFLLVWLKYSPFQSQRPFGLDQITSWPLVPIYWLAVSGLILGTFVDFEHLIIPDRVTWGGIAAGIALSILFPSLHAENSMAQGALRSIGGSALGFGILWIIGYVGSIIFKKEAMGFGDVKLLGAIGAFLGWRAVLFTLLVSSLVGSVVGVILVFAGKKDMQSRIPYGPYLALGALIWILWGSSLWDAYLNIFPRAEYR